MEEATGANPVISSFINGRTGCIKIEHPITFSFTSPIRRLCVVNSTDHNNICIRMERPINPLSGFQSVDGEIKQYSITRTTCKKLFSSSNISRSRSFSKYSIIALGYLHKLRHPDSRSVYMFAISRLRSQIKQSDFNTKLRFLFKRPFVEVVRIGLLR